MGTSWNEKPWVQFANGGILLGLMGYGGFLRAYGTNLSLYDTEILTRERAGESALYILQHGGAPIYDLLVKLSLYLGDSEVALRLPSILLGILTIAAAYGLLRHLHSRTAGLVAAAMVAFNPYLIHLGGYASRESYIVLCTLMAAWSLYGVLATRRWYAWFGYVVFSTLALAPNYTFLPAQLCMAACGMINLACSRAVGGVIWRIALVLFLAACTATGPTLLIERGHDPRSVYQLDADAGSVIQSLSTDSASRPRGGGLPEKNLESGAVRYRLTIFDCVEYLKRYFWNLTAWMWVGLIVVGVWGIADLCYRTPAAAAVFAPGFLVGPASLFLFSADHPYHFRDFSYLAIYATVLVAAGVCVMPRFVSRLVGSPRSMRLWRRVPAPPPKRAVTVANVLYPLIVIGLAIPLAPHLNRAFQNYPVYGYLPLDQGPTNRAPVHDWKGVFETAAPVAREADVFLFIGPTYGFGPRYARYYLNRLRDWGIEGGGPTLRAGTPSPALLKELAQSHPESNLWFIGTLKHHVNDFEHLMLAAGAVPRDFMVQNKVEGLRLYQLGAPTTNLALKSDFEAGWSPELPEGIELDRDLPYEGSRALRISARQSADPLVEPGARYAQIQVAHEGYRLRNNGFEAWRDGKPIGWHPNASAVSAMASDPGGFKGTTGLRIAPVEETAMLVQSIPVGLAPGRTLEVQTIARCNTPNNLHLVVRYDGPGYEVSQMDSHPGNGEWILLTAEMEIPADADPNSFTMEIWRTPGGEGDAIVDNVELRVKNLGGRLERERSYVASMMVRSVNLRDTRNSTTAPVGKSRLLWKDSAGQTGHFDLFSFHNNENWRLLQGTFRPGFDLPEDVEELYLEVGIDGGSGTLWVDNVQVEQGVRATPHTRTFRLPLDEALGAVDLEPFAVDISW